MNNQRFSAIWLVALIIALSNITFAQDKPAITVHVYQGPCGKPIKVKDELVGNDGTLKTEEITDANAKKPFLGKSFFSVYFIISVNPPIEITYQGRKGNGKMMDDYEFRGLKKDLEWVKVFLKITPLNDNGQTSGDVKSQELRVVRLAPEETDEMIQGENAGKNLKDFGKDIGDSIAPFMPKTLGDTTKNIAGFAGILFKNLIKPRLVAYQYAFLNDSNEFGWYWKRKKFKKDGSSLDNPVSLLGVKRSIAFIQIDNPNKAKKLKVEYRAIAKWSEDLGRDVDDENLSSNQNTKGEEFKNGDEFYDYNVKLEEAIGWESLDGSSCKIE